MSVIKATEVSTEDLVYDSDVCIILNEMELSELNIALKEWVDNNNLIKVQTVARINKEITDYIKTTE